MTTCPSTVWLFASMMLSSVELLPESRSYPRDSGSNPGPCGSDSGRVSRLGCRSRFLVGPDHRIDGAHVECEWSRSKRALARNRSILSSSMML